MSLPGVESRWAAMAGAPESRSGVESMFKSIGMLCLRQSSDYRSQAVPHVKAVRQEPRIDLKMLPGTARSGFMSAQHSRPLVTATNKVALPGGRHS